MFTKDDILTTDKFMALATPIQKISDIVYIKTDPLVHGKRGMKYRGKVILVRPGKVWITGHSDYPITQELFEKYKHMSSVWFTVNKDCSSSQVISIPLGITNVTTESHFLHQIYGNQDIMLEVMQQPRSPHLGLVYMNFSVGTHYEERFPCFQMFAGKDWVTVGKIENTLAGRKRFLTEIRNHKFVLCPRGNGIDTHRLWETLYMGSIPIVRRCTVMEEFADLPILFVDSWEEITPEFLEAKYADITSRTWNLEKLRFGYWRDRILGSVKAE